MANTSNPEASQKDSQQSHPSQTAADYIDEQTALEADAREVLPYKFNKCTYVLGPLRQEIYACLTCSPPPASSAQVYTPAGICYSCSISCHGDHNIVELFQRRNFVCDCGTTRLPSTSPCTLRSNPDTGAKGVASQEPGRNNRYNQNFQNKFCACQQEYDAETEKGTMFQCIGLGSVETGGCGEDWYHPECLMGLSKGENTQEDGTQADGQLQETGEHPMPSGFPDEDDFETFVCYKCVASNPWIKSYANTDGFLSPLFRKEGVDQTAEPTTTALSSASEERPSLKRKASDEDDVADVRPSSPTKRVKNESEAVPAKGSIPTGDDVVKPSLHKHERLPPAPSGTFSLFLREDFREHLCHCPSCFPNLLPHPQLLEEEDTYEPSVSEDSGVSNAAPHSSARSQGTASLLERGEAALNNVDRVRAIEGVMVYNHLKDKVKEFLKPYAESGKAVSAEDIKAYFEKLRGDEEGIKEAGDKPVPADDSEGDNRREQSGY